MVRTMGCSPERFPTLGWPFDEALNGPTESVQGKGSYHTGMRLRASGVHDPPPAVTYRPRRSVCCRRFSHPRATPSCSGCQGIPTPVVNGEWNPQAVSTSRKSSVYTFSRQISTIFRRRNSTPCVAVVRSRELRLEAIAADARERFGTTHRCTIGGAIPGIQVVFTPGATGFHGFAPPRRQPSPGRQLARCARELLACPLDVV